MTRVAIINSAKGRDLILMGNPNFIDSLFLGEPAHTPNSRASTWSEVEERSTGI